MGDQIPIRLRPVVLEEDCKLALKWYQDNESIFECLQREVLEETV
jgi:hypothetical protein